MQVRMKIGPQTGKLVDLPYSAARNLVEMDQAEDIDNQMRLPKAQASRIDAATVENAEPMGESSNAAPVQPRHAGLDVGKIDSRKKKK